MARKCYVSTPTSLVRYPSKRAAIERAKVLGAAVHYECECGCGEPAGQPFYHAPPANEDSEERIAAQRAETMASFDQSEARRNVSGGGELSRERSAAMRAFPAKTGTRRQEAGAHNDNGPSAAQNNEMSQQMTETALWLYQSRAEGTPREDVVRAMQQERRAKRVAAEELFGCGEERP